MDNTSEFFDCDIGFNCLLLVSLLILKFLENFPSVANYTFGYMSTSLKSSARVVTLITLFIRINPY